jgi:DEP domain-containing protein 5
MTRSNQIHRLECDHSGTINVQVYTKRHIPRPEDDFKREYHPFVKTKFASSYEQSLGNIFDPSIREVKWNLLDQQLAGFGDVDGASERMFKIRFVIVPATIKSGITEGVNEKLTPEELRVEGLRKVIGLIHRGSYQTPEEKKRLKGRKKEKVPPEIKFYTGELGSYLVQLYEEYNLSESMNDKGTGSMKRKDSLLVSSLERLNKSIKLTHLAVEMQDSLRGIRLVDRRWHWKTHKNCFIGQELVVWMLETFTDIHTADEAVEYGNSLMESGLFHHVEHRHSFLNGHYFYQLNPEYIIQNIKEKDKMGWFRPGHGRKVSDLSANTNAEVISGKDSPLTPRLGTDGSTLKSNASYSSDTTNTPRTIPKMLISRALKFDVDSSGRSKRSEYFTIHVDRVHNPENAFHLRLEWLNTTPKLIEDAIVNISRVCDRYGLKLVQVPIEEINVLPNDYPFCSLLRTKFVLEVPGLDPEELTDPDNPLGDDLFYYHKYFLHKLGFVVDLVPASSLMKTEIDIEYSWGRPAYSYGQYIHKSGLVIAQIVQNEFVLMINSLHLSRVSVTGTGVQPGGLPPASASQTSVSPTDIIDEIKSECENGEKLRAVFNEARTIFIVRRRGNGGDHMYGGTNSDSSGTSTPRNVNARSLVMGQ